MLNLNFDKVTAYLVRIYLMQIKNLSEKFSKFEINTHKFKTHHVTNNHDFIINGRAIEKITDFCLFCISFFSLHHFDEEGTLEPTYNGKIGSRRLNIIR